MKMNMRKNLSQNSLLTKENCKEKGKDVSTQFERIIMVMGIVAAILVAVVVILYFPD